MEEGKEDRGRGRGGEKSLPEKLGTGRTSTTLGPVGKGSALEIVNLS
jgi:hypothetical protein